MRAFSTFFILRYIKQYTHIKGIVFFFPRKSLKIDTFGKKSSEWVKNVFFFSAPVFFFFRPLRSSEWVGYKLFLGKKIHIFVGKKKHRKSAKVPVSQGELSFCRVSGFQTFPGKKKYNCIFFSQKREKKNENLRKWVSEWR